MQTDTIERSCVKTEKISSIFPEKAINQSRNRYTYIFSLHKGISFN